MTPKRTQAWDSRSDVAASCGLSSISTPPATSNAIASINTTGGDRSENVIGARIMSVVVLCRHQALEFFALQRWSLRRGDFVLIIKAVRDHDFIADDPARTRRTQRM